MAFILENIRLKELVAIARANKPFFDDWIAYLAAQGYSTLHAFVREADEKLARLIIQNYLENGGGSGSVNLLDGVGAAYQPEKGRWLLLGWIFRDAPEQRLRPLVSHMPGRSVTEKQAALLNEVRQKVADVFQDESSWSWSSVLEVMVDRLEGSRRAKKGNLFELIVRRCLKTLFDAKGLKLDVCDTQLRIGTETYDVVVRGTSQTLLIPVKTRETMGGGHAHIFTRDIHKSVAEAVGAGYPVLPIVIAESWTGNLGGLACADFIYLQMNPNQVADIEPILMRELDVRTQLFGSL